MPCRSLIGKIGRSPMLGRMCRQVRFCLFSLCCAGLALAGASISPAIAQEFVVDPNPDGGVANDDTPMEDSSTIPTDGGMTDDGNKDSGVEVTTTEVVDDPLIVGDGGSVDENGVIIQPYYRNLHPTNDVIPVDDPFWGGPPIYYMFGGSFELSSLATSAQTSNQLAVATQLDALDGNTTPELQQLIDDIGLLAPNQQRAAYDSLSGETYGTLSSIGLQIGQQSLRTVSNRLVNNLMFLSGGGGMLLGQRSSARTAIGGDQLVRGQSPVFGATGWVQGFGSSGSWSNNGNAAGADYRLNGFAYGADLAGDETGVIGITGGHSHTQLGTDRGDSGNVTSHQVGVYMLKNFDSFYGLGVFNYGHNNNKLVRQVTIGPVQQLVASGLKSNQFGTYGEAGLNLDSEAVRLQPFFGLQYLSLTNGSAFEGPGGGVGLNVNGNNTSTFQTHLGARAILQTLRSSSGVEFRPYLSGRWVADLLGSDSSTTAGFGGAPAGASWVVTGNHSGRHTGQIGPGFTAQVADGVALFANYDFVFGEHFTSHTGSGGVLFEF